MVEVVRQCQGDARSRGYGTDHVDRRRGGEDGNASVVAVDIVLVVGDDVRRPSSASSMDVMVGSLGVIYRTYMSLLPTVFSRGTNMLRVKIRKIVFCAGTKENLPL